MSAVVAENRPPVTAGDGDEARDKLGDLVDDMENCDLSSEQSNSESTAIVNPG